MPKYNARNIVDVNWQWDETRYNELDVIERAARLETARALIRIGDSVWKASRALERIADDLAVMRRAGLTGVIREANHIATQRRKRRAARRRR